MNVVEAREELEAAIWRAASSGGDAAAVDAALAAADGYAEAAADERIAGRVLSRTIGQRRLALLAEDIGLGGRTRLRLPASLGRPGKAA